jgi:hypothetical protein
VLLADDGVLGTGLDTGASGTGASGIGADPLTSSASCG